MKRKICIITGTRAEYGLLEPLINELSKDKRSVLQLIITGMHLSPEFGFTVEQINTKIFNNIEKIEILLSSDSEQGVIKSMGIGLISFAEAFERLKPDIVIGLGDRFELFSAVTAAYVSKIPVAHIHGGELTSGAFDDGFRHSITKMSHLHFAAAERYRQRIIQLGEDPSRVFNTGALGIDNLRNLKLLSNQELSDSIGFALDSKYFLVTFHPATLDTLKPTVQINELLAALDSFKNFKIVFTNPNADSGGRIIKRIIEDYCAKSSGRAVSFASLGQLKYLSALKHSEMVIGNSSSGILETVF